MRPSADQSPAPFRSRFASGAIRRVALLLAPGSRARPLAIVAASSLVALVLVAVVSGPIVRGVAEARAEALGLRIGIRAAGLSWGGVRLGGVTLSCTDVPSVTAELGRVEVSLGLLLSPRRVRVHGGSVVVRAGTERLDEELHAYRAAHPRKGGSSDGDARVLPVSVDGVDVAWNADAKTSARVWGIRYERAEDGAERAGADLARMAMGSLHIDVERANASFERDGGERKLTEVGATRVSAMLVDDSAPEPVAPRAPPRNQGTGTTEPESHASRWLSLRAELGRAATSAAKALRPGTALGLPDVRFELRHGDQVLNVGPAKAVLERSADALKAQVTSGVGERAPPIRFDVVVPLGGGPVDIGLAGGPVSLAALGVQEHDMGLEAVSRAEVEVSGRARLTADGTSVHLSGGARSSDLSLLEPRLSKEVVRGLRLGASGDADVALDGSALRFTDVEAQVGNVKFVASGSLERSEGHARGKLHLDIPLAACTDMLASVPDGLVPLVSGLEMTGTFVFAGDVSFDTRRPRDTRVAADAANGCKITRVPAQLSPDRFTHPWTRTVLDASGLPATIESGPGTRDWVPLTEVSPYVATAVVVCEDANFFTHSGFNQKSIQDSIRDDLAAGRFVRGGSTVSMQLAKNLYLKREKTLSRKLQEALLTMLLEQTLTKERILELYLNVIEFAPGLYGIGPAAEHYFHSTPRELSLGQALYLISLLPNPKVHHFKADGSLTDRWAEYLRHLMDIAHKIRRIDDRELAVGLAEEIRRGVAAAPGESAGGNDDDLGTFERGDPDGP
jgi:hypothetical protein